MCIIHVIHSFLALFGLTIIEELAFWQHCSSQLLSCEGRHLHKYHTMNLRNLFCTVLFLMLDFGLSQSFFFGRSSGGGCRDCGTFISCFLCGGSLWVYRRGHSFHVILAWNSPNSLKWWCEKKCFVDVLTTNIIWECAHFSTFHIQIAKWHWNWH